MRQQHQTVTEELGNQDRPCQQERRKNFRSHKTVTRWLKRTRNERVRVERGSVGTRGPEFSPIGEVSQDKCTDPQALAPDE